MIECKDCRLPTLPPVLFWEGIFGMRLPCLCGCRERTRIGDFAAPAAPVIDQDAIDQMRAADEGMPEWHGLERRTGRTQDFRKWLETRDKKTLAATAANTDTVVRKVFRPLPLKNVFGPLSGRAVLAPAALITPPPERELYISGWTRVIRQ